MNCEILENLIQVIEKIYDIYMSVDVNISMIDNIEDLILEENSYINKLPKRISDLEEISVAVRNSYDNDSIVKKHFILDRLDSILDKRKVLIESDQIDDGYGSYNLINTNMMCQLIEEINNDKLRYLIAFSNVDIEEKLLSSNFDINKIKSLSKDYLSDKLSLDIHQYEELSDEVIGLEINRLLFEIVAIKKENDYSDLISYNLEIIKKLILKLSPSALLLKKEEILNNNLINSEIKDELDLLSEPIEISQDLEDFSKNEFIDDEIFNKLSSLIKLEEVILSRYDSLDITDRSSISIFLNLLEYEKEMVNSIMIDNDADKFVDMVFKDSSFFFEGEDCLRKRKLIGDRIYNLFPAFRRLFSEHSIDCQDLVISNHIVNSLVTFRDLMCDLNDDQFNKYVLTYKDVIFVYPNLLNDIMVLNGDFTALFSYDDQFSSTILNINSDRSLVYSYDKDDILYNLAKNIIFELKDILFLMEDNPDYISLYEFKICEFNDIINNINTEHLYALEDDVESIDNSKIKSILMNSLPFYHKY